MPEGPSIIIATEELARFKRKKVLSVEGNARFDQSRLVNRTVKDIRSWGKHLLIVFDKFFIRVHFLLFGKYLVDERKDKTPSLSLQFSRGEVNFYTSAVSFYEGSPEAVYDWSSDIMSEEWDQAAAIKKLKKQPDTIVADALLDQEIFSGVGNIIKNEVLFRTRIHPASLVGALPPSRMKELVKQARQYSFDFYKWKKEFVLAKHWQVHKRKICPVDGAKLEKEYIGKTARRTFFCSNCQQLYPAV